MESSGQELWIDDGYFTGYSRPPTHSWKPLQAHFQGQSHLQGLLCLTGSSGFVGVTPTTTSSSSTQSLGFPQGLLHPYPEVNAPGRIFFPGFSYSQSANSTKSRMQAQSSASAMLWLHTAYTGATPGILTTLPKPAKGMREKLVAWKKRSNIWNYYQEQQKLLLYAAGHMKHFPSN